VTAFANLLLERADAVATIRLNRPKALNALDTATLQDLARALRDVRRDGDVRAVVVTGAGDKAFSAGADIAAMAAMSAVEGHAFSRLGHEVLGRLEALPIPVVAAVGGVALGGGLELALACDLIVAADRARLGQPEINLGLIPGFGGTQRLVWRVGVGRARELVYLGRQLSRPRRSASGSSIAWCPPSSSRPRPRPWRRSSPPRRRSPDAGQARRGGGDRGRAGHRPALRERGLRRRVRQRGPRRGLRAFLERRTPAWKGR